MIISRTPFRISFLGGGTDYPVWFREHGGAVLATTIDKYCYISCRHLPPFFDHRTRIAYSRIEHVNSNEEIEHPAVRGVLKYLNVHAGLEIHHDGDLPARTGLGSSSSFTVGLLHTLYALQHTMPSKAQLAQAAIHVEQDILQESVGCQDQVLAAHGGFCKLDFFSNGEIGYTPIVMRPERLAAFQSYLQLYFTGFSRIASEVAREQISCTQQRQAELFTMLQMVQEGMAILSGDRDLSDFGALLHEAWMLKRRLTSRITTPAIDEIYTTACSAGALGGKLLGAGGGGFMLLFARPEDHERIRLALPGLLQVPFRFEGLGSQIVFYQEDQLILDDVWAQNSAQAAAKLAASLMGRAA
ncbi:MAG: putative galactokinase [Nitrospira sp. OLB3]|nr:MAG: putative galactokinase [Nitrospira sp. OLB3]MCE7965648.1 kinase [Nitrospira sp. NTP2]RIK58992.1 MAG: kinase [Nitrospira sp.]